MKKGRRNTSINKTIIQHTPACTYAILKQCFICLHSLSTSTGCQFIILGIQEKQRKKHTKTKPETVKDVPLSNCNADRTKELFKSNYILSGGI